MPRIPVFVWRRVDRDAVTQLYRRATYGIRRHLQQSMSFTIVLFVAALAGCSSDGIETSTATPDCSNLLHAQIASTTITTATLIPAGTDLKSITGASGSLAAPTCRVVATVSTQPGEQVGIEVWLPQSGWNGRLFGVGSGGFGGVIPYSGIVSASARGFVAAGTDTGHIASTTFAWMNNPVQLRDWGHTSIHLMTVAAKAITQTYYGQGAQHAYYEGCSTGGAEGMEEAEYFPTDYDGIHAGSPGMAYSHLMESFMWGGVLPAKEPASLLTSSALSVMSSAVLASCGSSSATKDGYLANPLACHFDVTQLQCKSGQDASSCLSAAQVSQAQHVYSPVLDARSGKQIYPGFALGSEPEWTLIQGINAVTYAKPLLGTVLFNNPNWDWTSFDFASDADLVDQKLTPYINATNTDLTAFQQRGGKLVMTQGWVDSFNAQTLPIEYFEDVVQQQGDLDTTQRFFRLVMVPGMDHCGGGPGANTIGGAVAPVSYDASRDVVSALQAWVEQGSAPQSFVATHYVSNYVPASGVAFERPVCVYPAYPQYSGMGDVKLASSYQCVAGPRLPASSP